VTKSWEEEERMGEERRCDKKLGGRGKDGRGSVRQRAGRKGIGWERSCVTKSWEEEERMGEEV
jgi:hypothetical protein